MNEMSKKCCDSKENPRLGRVGGQAVLEGVMMKAGNRTVTSCRLEDGSISVSDGSFVSVRKKYKILDIPVLRGVVNFIEMMILSFKTLNVSAEAMGIEDEDGKVERWLKKHLGVKLTDVIMIFSLILGLALSLVLFKILPALASDGLNYLTERFFDVSLGAWRAVVEGVVKVGIFLGYLIAVSFMKDIRRTFMYHGAEHKSIACFESGEELTPENAMKCKRFHPRCGTSFMFLMIALGIVISLCIRIALPELHPLAYVGISLLTLPLTMGIGYELLMIAGKHDNFLTRFISTPGLWVQRITTKEPTEDMLEIAITSLKCALRDDYPEFMEFYNSRAWEKKDTAEDTDEKVAEDGEAEKAATDEAVTDEAECDGVTAECREGGAADTANRAESAE